MKKIIIIALLTAGLLQSCNYITGERIKGNGTIKTENRQAAGFSSVSVSGNIDLYVRQDSSYQVRIETDENLQEYIETTTDGDLLDIRVKRGFNLSGTKTIKAYVSSPVYAQLKASGSCDIMGESSISSAHKLVIDLSGSSDVTLDVNTPAVETSLSGAGSIALSGVTKNFTVSGSGSTAIKCMELKSENVEVSISGSGSASVFASVKLDVRVSGSGSVKYKGNAAVSQRISGSGSVQKVE